MVATCSLYMHTFLYMILMHDHRYLLALCLAMLFLKCLFHFDFEIACIHCTSLFTIISHYFCFLITFLNYQGYINTHCLMCWSGKGSFLERKNFSNYFSMKHGHKCKSWVESFFLQYKSRLPCFVKGYCDGWSTCFKELPFTKTSLNYTDKTIHTHNSFISMLVFVNVCACVFVSVCTKYIGIGTNFGFEHWGTFFGLAG